MIATEIEINISWKSFLADSNSNEQAKTAVCTKSQNHFFFLTLCLLHLIKIISMVSEDKHH